ncbi:hypothetical protein HNO92_002220 [Chromobacterium alkanivorans]|uniref:TniQ family protein n=1 Tax=Chromobacterium alkanivorans TaxID=1071719 RepID=UPI002168EBF1|nr:TniQ family protein [Chromobacterium alkanivorans]MCS3805043.1 hypothetical protein [Chromobacterium alkanivorans]MCS3819394.1 hypothetical protein [Chromobacterium alkanivorans]MCS3873906.1 hypothetical protein [Chromobacterium alkanivorans]
MTPLLPIHPSPFPLESAIGYLLRLGTANDFHSLTWHQNYRRHIGLPAQSFEDFVELATGHGPNTQQRLWGPSSSDLPIQPHKKLGIKITYWSLDHRRWCPECLRENGYWKAEWLLTLQATCPHHRCLLQELCPACGQSVGWYSGGLKHCRCGQALTVGTLIPASDSLLQISQLISDKLAETTGVDAGATPPYRISDGLAHLLADVGLPRFLDLLWALGCYGHFRELKKSLKVYDHHRLAVALPVLESAARILTQWPEAFHSFMLEACNQSETHALHLYRFAGAHLLALNRTLNHPELHFVRYEFERFVSEHWKGIIADRHRFADDITAGHPTILAKEAMAILGITRRKLITLVNHGHIQGWYQQSNGNLRFLVIDRQSVLRFKQGCAGQLLTLTEAAEYLATTIPRVRLFVEAGLLTVVYKPEGNNDHRLHWAFEKPALDKLLGGLNIQIHATPECDSVISLERICRARSRDGADLVTLLRAIQAGELDCIARDPCHQGIKGLLLDKQRFEAWFAIRLQAKQFFTMKPAARYLGLKEHVLYWLRDCGLLYGFVYPDGASKPWLTKAALDSLKARYAWGLALEEMTGYGRKSAARALINRGVVPVTGPTIDGGTTYLFLREDIKRFLTAQQSATAHSIEEIRA